jgi:hypothetical protein
MCLAEAYPYSISSMELDDWPTWAMAGKVCTPYGYQEWLYTAQGSVEENLEYWSVPPPRTCHLGYDLRCDYRCKETEHGGCATLYNFTRMRRLMPKARLYFVQMSIASTIDMLVLSSGCQ